MITRFRGLIERKGIKYYLSRNVDTGVLIDSSIPSKGNVFATQSYSIVGVESVYSNSSINYNELIESTDIVMYAISDEVCPQDKDVITVNNVTYRVMDTKKYRYKGEVVYYELQLRN